MGLNNFLVISLLSVALCFAKEWTTLRGDLERTGYLTGSLRPPFRLVWVRHFEGERISTCVEPIIADGKLFIPTHNRNLYALDARTGEPIWRFQAHGAFLHSPAFARDLVIAGNTDGFLYALEAGSGEMRWRVFGGRGGFSSSPTIAEGKVFIGSRSGKFIAVELASGKIIWQKDIGVPIRQTASYSEGKLFVTAEDMRVRCWKGETGELLWTSQPLIGQTARDYYPIIVKVGNKKFLIIRTNPILNMAQLLSRDRGLICQNAGVDDSDWRNIDAWIKSEESRGSEELWEKEQEAIIRYLEEHPEARTFFVLDAETGKEVGQPPILWTGGCQGVGNLPVALPNGTLLLIYRTAYGNWTLGVAPLVSLGILDLTKNRITPLFHKQGHQPPWNTFWGTADESQNFLLIGDELLIIHQGTLSGFDLRSKELFPIWGERDSWMGFRNLPWARNEWHGPSRGSAAVVDERIYLQVGSRVLCIAMGEEGEPGQDIGIKGENVPTNLAPPPPQTELSQLKELLSSSVEGFLSTNWMPLYIEPGLAGGELFFRRSSDVFETLSWAFPHLPQEFQKRVKTYLAKEWEEHPPYSPSYEYNFQQGNKREWADIPLDLRTPQEDGPHPFGNIYAVWLYAERCGEWERVRKSWEEIKASFKDFLTRGWQLDEKGDLWANRYLASLIAFQKIAERIGDSEAVEEARRMVESTSSALIRWWQRSEENLKLPIFQNIVEWDTFIGKGDFLFLSIRPHKAKLALFHDLTPEVASLLKEKVPDALNRIWQIFQLLCPTWHLVGEERQVHYGENYLDPPDFSLDAFKSLAWLKDASWKELTGKLDIPFSQADLFFIVKLATILDKAGNYSRKETEKQGI